MKHVAIEQVLQRAQRGKTDSDFTYFFSLLLAGEALAKTVVLGMVAAIADDKDRNRYRLEHSLVRSDGLGDWARVLDDALTGPASEYLLVEARSEQTALTKMSRAGDWQYSSLVALKTVLEKLQIDAEELPVKSDMKRWFRFFATLRNKTRAHGATLPDSAGKVSLSLAESIETFYRNFKLFARPWAHLYRNLSGKYRVSAITEDTGPFEHLKRENKHSLPNGIYVWLGSFCRVPLMQTDPELHDVFFANGGFSTKTFELLSYSTDDRADGDTSAYLVPPGTLPPSETQGQPELFVKGRCFTNVPDLISDYIARPRLEGDLRQLLLDDKRPIVTLVGRGGIGKTSLALRVIHRVCDEARYQAIAWLSARDVDLQLTGPKPVRPLVLSPDDIGKLYATLVLSPEDTKAKGFNARAFFEEQLQRCALGPCLFVFDNFETTQNPLEMFTWIDAFIRLPNKALITTRLRDFKGDYPLEVRGMEEDEALKLVNQTASHLGVAQLINKPYIDDLISQSEGHPYVIKILLGEVAKAGRAVNIPRVVAASDEILTALFERTYASLSPCAQRAFMTLAAWNSAVPRIALEAVLLRSTEQRQEVENGIEHLLQFSLAEAQTTAIDKQEFIGLPLVASVFGKKKLNVSPFKSAIQADVEILQMLGPSRRRDTNLGLEKRLESFVSNIARRVDSGASYEEFAPILEMICRAYNPGWLILARWHIEMHTNEGYEKAKAELRRFLENASSESDTVEAWRMLATACYHTGDFLEELHAFIERAQIGSVPFRDISRTANRLNEVFSDNELEIDREQKRTLAERLLEVLERRIAEAEPDDYSRMAWLAFHLGKDNLARNFAETGLQIDPKNYHCGKIVDRLNRRRFGSQY
jgi:hypothetical protein